MIPFEAWAPDLDPTTPGVLSDVSDAIPTKRGYAGAPSAADAVSGLAALAAECRGIATVSNTSGTRRTIAGTQTKLYELSGTAWTDVSRTSSYAGSSESRWIMDQFGDVTLATNNVEKIQWSSAGAFSDVTAAPVARIMFTTRDFVFAMDYDHTAAGNVADGWWCSAFQDYSSWDASTSTQATRGRLIGNGGAITAGAKLGPYAVAYKADAVFLGQYVGPPVVWQWDRIPGVAGCVGPEAICDIGGRHVFVGRDDIWLFDGTRPTSIAEAVKETFFRNSNASYLYKSIVRHDETRDLVWIFYPSSSSTTLDRAAIWNLKTGKWGKMTIAVEASNTFVSPGLTYDTWSSAGSTYNTLPDSPYDSAAFASGSRSLAIVNTSHVLKAMTGVSAGGSVTTGDIGDDDRYSLLRKSRVRFTTVPTSASAQGFYRSTTGGTLSGGSSSTMTDGKFDHRQSGRWHRIVFSMTGPFEASGFDAEILAQGTK